ncbi:MAG: glycine cleavage system protein GcvH [Myxococcota bacterium]|jgi:glycine cleavage system H protein|nr:glycine cleavage system protein GcvH [Myxococcota bacterium]
MNIPSGLRYTKDHEWAKIEGTTATIGITEFAVSQLGDITLVEMPKVGAEIKAGQAIGTIESVKAVSDMYAPLSGKVLEINAELDNAPEQVNDSPYESGWMFKLHMSKPAEAEGLMDASSYAKHLETLDH